MKRGGAIQEFVMATAQWESWVGEKEAFPQGELSVGKVSRTDARENQLTADPGMRVLGVSRGIRRRWPDLRPGNIITKINRQTILSLETTRMVHESYPKAPQPLFVETVRNHRVSLNVFKL